ncbi:MAG: hypothetical protein ACREMM_09095 [Gemmatimonadales bacterium]
MEAPQLVTLHGNDLMALIAAIILSADRDPARDEAVTTAVVTARKLMKQVAGR